MLNKKNPCSANNTFEQRDVLLNKIYHSIEGQNFKVPQFIFTPPPPSKFTAPLEVYPANQFLKTPTPTSLKNFKILQPSLLPKVRGVYPILLLLCSFLQRKQLHEIWIKIRTEYASRYIFGTFFNICNLAPNLLN